MCTNSKALQIYLQRSCTNSNALQIILQRACTNSKCVAVIFCNANCVAKNICNGLYCVAEISIIFFKNRSSLSAASQYKFYSTIIYNKTNNCMKKPIQLLHHDGSYIYNKTHQKHVV